MCVVERVAVFSMLVEEEILWLVCDEMTGQNLGLRTVKGSVFVGVCHVACGRQQEKNVGGWALAGRAHYEIFNREYWGLAPRLSTKAQGLQGEGSKSGSMACKGSCTHENSVRPGIGS